MSDTISEAELQAYRKREARRFRFRESGVGRDTATAADSIARGEHNSVTVAGHDLLSPIVHTHQATDLTNNPTNELGGTWSFPTVSSIHSGSAHHTQAHQADHTDGTDDIQTATTAQKGVVSELATAAETSTGTDTARVIPVVALPLQIQDSKYNFVADTASDDDYLIALTPSVTAYATGQVFYFTAQTANTGACTLNVDGLGAKAIKKLHDQDPASNDIEAGQIVMVQYDGTVFQMQSQIAAAGGGGQDLATDTLWAAQGDLVKGTADNAADILSIGADHTILVSNGTDPSWSAAPPLANIADTGDTNRIGLATSDPHVTLTGTVTLPFDDNVASGTLRQLRISPTIGSNAGFWRAIDIAPNVTLSGNSRSVYGVIGSATVPAPSASTSQIVEGLFFAVAPETISVSATFLRARGAEVGVNAVALGSGTLTVTEASALHGIIQTTQSGSASAVITTGNGLFVASPTGVGTITTYHGVRVEDATTTITNNRLLEIGPSTPYLRVAGNFTAAANETALSLSEGVTPTLRQVKSTDVAYVSITNDEAMTASAAEVDVFDQDNYPDSNITQTVNVTAKNVTYTASNGRFTADVAGIYVISISLPMNTASGTPPTTVLVKDTGVAFHTGSIEVHSAVDEHPYAVTLVRSLSATDYINVTIDSQDVSTIQTTLGATLSMYKIADVTDDKVVTLAN